MRPLSEEKGGRMLVRPVAPRSRRRRAAETSCKGGLLRAGVFESGTASTVNHFWIVLPECRCKLLWH